MSHSQPEREALAARIRANAEARAANVSNAGARAMLFRAAEARAERVLAGLPVDLSFLRTPVAPVQRRENRAAPVPRDLRDADGAAMPIVVRACLRCRRLFNSHGPGNRMCEPCHVNASAASPYAV